MVPALFTRLRSPAVSRGFNNLRWFSSAETRPVVLTPNAVERLCSVSKKRGEETAIRLKVDSGGCGGFVYHLEVIPRKEATGGDSLVPTVLEDGSSGSVVIDELSKLYVEECKIDFIDEMAASKFAVVGNKLADMSCSCGASFSVPDF